MPLSHLTAPPPVVIGPLKTQNTAAARAVIAAKTGPHTKKTCAPPQCATTAGTAARDVSLRRGLLRGGGCAGSETASGGLSYTVRPTRSAAQRRDLPRPAPAVHPKDPDLLQAAGPAQFLGVVLG